MAAGAIRDSNRRRRAENESAAQWRSIGRVAAAVTNQRFLIQFEGQWQVYPMGSLVSMQPEVEYHSLVLHFDGCAPLRVRGPWVPWLTVVITSLTFNRPWPAGFRPPVVLGPQQRPMMAGRQRPGAVNTGAQPAVGQSGQVQPGQVQPGPSRPAPQARDGVPTVPPTTPAPPTAPDDRIRKVEDRPDATAQNYIQRLRNQG